METRTNKRLLTAVICVMMCAAASARAQNDSLDRNYNLPCTSTWTSYSNLTETYSMVRSNITNHVVYVREETDLGEMRHTFIIKKSINSPATAFSTFFVYQKKPAVIITDMRLYGDTCYFCGRVNRPATGSGPATRGFVGRFVTDEMVAGWGQVEYYIVDTTSQLTRLAISRDDTSHLLISAIGEEYYSGKACIVELANHGASGWTKRYEEIFTADNIVFSDIMTMRDSLTLLAQYACVNENPPGSGDYDYSHQIFLLDRFKLKGCSATHTAPCNIALYCLPIVGGCYFHRDRVPMRLFHINDQNKEFGVAFGVVEEDMLHSGIRLFKFQHAWEYYNSLYYRVSAADVEIKEIGNMYKSDTLCVLSASSSNPKGLITLPGMGVGSNPVTFFSHPSYTFNSLTQKFTGNHIDISGRDGSSDFHLFDQYVYQTSAPTCFFSTPHQYEPLPGTRAAKQYISWNIYEEKVFEWEKAEITELEISTDIVCEKCN